MEKDTHHGLRKLGDDPQVTTVSIGGLVGKDYVPKKPGDTVTRTTAISPDIQGLRPGDIGYQGQYTPPQPAATTPEQKPGEQTRMGKVTHHGLRKPDDPIYQNGSTTVSIGGLVKPKPSASAPTPMAQARPAHWPEWKTEEFPPSGYKPHPEDDTFYPRNPNERRKLPEK